jgi:lysophospholipase L1-like esterase
VSPRKCGYTDLTHATPESLQPLRGVYGVPDMLGEDHMHPNAEGYARVAENVLHGIQSIWLENYLDARSRR